MSDFRRCAFFLKASDEAEEAILHNDLTDISDIVAQIRKVTDVPVVLEIGVDYPEAEYETIADGFVVENAIVNLIAKHGKDAAKPIYDYVKKTVENL